MSGEKGKAPVRFSKLRKKYKSLRLKYKCFVRRSLSGFSFITIRGCYFAFYSKYGVYRDNKDFPDNGDNAIIDN